MIGRHGAGVWPPLGEGLAGAGVAGTEEGGEHGWGNFGGSEETGPGGGHSELPVRPRVTLGV